MAQQACLGGTGLQRNVITEVAQVDARVFGRNSRVIREPGQPGFGVHDARGKHLLEKSPGGATAGLGDMHEDKILIQLWRLRIGSQQLAQALAIQLLIVATIAANDSERDISDHAAV